MSPDGRRATVTFLDRTPTASRPRAYRAIVDLATGGAELAFNTDGSPVAFAPDDLIWVERDGERPGGHPPEFIAFDRTGRAVAPIEDLRGILFRGVAVSRKGGAAPTLRELTTGRTLELSTGWTEAGLFRSQAARRHRSGDRRVVSGCAAVGADRVIVRWLDVDEAFAAARDTTRDHEVTLTRPGMRGECAVSAEGTLVALIAQDDSFSIYRVADGRELSHQPGRFSQLAFAGDDTLVAAGDGGLTIVVLGAVTQVTRHADPLGQLSAAGPVVLWRSHLAPDQPRLADRAPVGHLFAAAGRRRKLLAHEFELADALGGRVELLDRFTRWQRFAVVQQAAVLAPERAVFFGLDGDVPRLWILDAGGRRLTVPMPSLPVWRS